MLFKSFVELTKAAPEAVFATVIRGRKEEILTRGEVLARAIAVIDALRDNGVAPGAVVPIVLEHSAWLYPTFIGCVLGGYVPSFLPPWNAKQDPVLFAEGMRVLFARLMPGSVITSRASEGSIPQGEHARIHVDDLSAAANDRTVAMRDDESGLAFLQHSSGTTGHKKGVMITHRQVCTHLAAYGAAIRMAPGDVVASWLPLYHDMGLITSFLLPATLGCPIVSLDALEWVARPTILLDAMERHRAAFAWLPNFAFHHIPRGDRGDKPRDLHAVKAIINCSEPCRAETFARFAGRYAAAGLGADKLGVSYALAENVFAVTQTPPGQTVRAGRAAATANWLSCGQVLPGVTIAIRDADGTPVADGDIGEIHISTNCLFDGYFRQPHLSAERLSDNWYRTGDLGCLEAGELFVVGRADDLMIIGGKNVLAHEIEDAISTLPGVAPGRVLACQEFNEASGARDLVVLVETIEPAPDARVLDDSVRRLVFSISGVSVSAVAVVPRGFLVKSSSGKIARAASQRKWRDGSPKAAAVSTSPGHFDKLIRD